MRLFLVAILTVGLTFSAYAQKPAKNKAAQGTAKVELKSFQDSVAYAIGLNIGGNLLKDELFLNLDIIKAGLEDAVNQNTQLLTKEQIEQVFQTFSMQMQEKQMKQQEEKGAKNSEAGKKFLDENKKRPEVKVTPSGLQYEVLRDGTGAKPNAESKVRVHYVGTLINGTKFDSSVDRGEPISFPLNGVIPGWTEGVQLMPVGSKFKFYIPSELAYGERGAPGGAIGPNETLIFEVELLGIEE